MKITIRHRTTGATLYEGEHESLRGAVTAAVAAGANLAGANLADANLARANLADANLADAYLARANLADAYLAGANLAGANLARASLAGADLADAYLAGADLAGADLADAYLAGADLAGADLADAYLAGADLAGADLAGADLADAKNVRPGDATDKLPIARKRIASRAEARRDSARRFREHHPDVPVVEQLDERMLEVVTAPGNRLNMGDWHTCETTHCRGGWAIHLAGKAGYELEQRVGVQHAARMIYRASTGRSPHFFATQDRALEDIKRCAEEATGAQ